MNTGDIQERVQGSFATRTRTVERTSDDATHEPDGPASQGERTPVVQAEGLGRLLRRVPGSLPSHVQFGFWGDEVSDSG